jgi:ZIP family zinc transporter
MSSGQIALLGAVAGVTIYLGLPIGRLRSPAPRLRAALNALAIGILLFLVWDVLSHAWDPTDQALGAKHWGKAVGGGAVLFAGLGAGLCGLVSYDRWNARRLAAAGAEGRRGAADLAMMIAVGIGLHNFAEGLAIGNSAATGQISLAVLLIIGFGLHNATEGFGIVAPLAAEGTRPSWGSLVLLGLVGGGPTFVGTLVGQHLVNDYLSIAFLGLAAGSILYVVIELLAVARRAALKELTTWMILVGLMAGFVTDAVVTAGGA